MTAVDPGRLAPVAELVDAARAGEVNLKERLEQSMPGIALTAEATGQILQMYWGVPPTPDWLGMGGFVVWQDTALFATESNRPVAVSVDGRDPVQMTAVPGTTYWFALADLEPGRLHTYSYSVDGKSLPSYGFGNTEGDIPGYNPLSYEQPGVRRGTLSEQRTVYGSVYPGAKTNYWLYVNDGVDERRGAPVMIWHDGEMLLEPSDLIQYRMKIVTDNLVHQGLIPPMVHVLLPPGEGGDELADIAHQPGYLSSMRHLQYDTVSDRFGRHVLEDLLPDVERVVKLRSDGYSRGSAGASSGGMCALKMAWFAPVEFSRVHSVIGTFAGLRWAGDHSQEPGQMLSYRVRTEAKRNIRVWISTGSNDVEHGSEIVPLYEMGGNPLNNIQLANALKGAGYDFHFRFGEGYHTYSQAGLDLPESLAWLWRDYDPDRTEQEFEQDASEREKPVFRVQIANR